MRAERFVACVGLSIMMSLGPACGGCDDPAVQDDMGSERCPEFGQERNPITGMCQFTTEPRDMDTARCPEFGQERDPITGMCQFNQPDGGTLDMGGDAEMEDMRRVPPDMPQVMVDLSDDDECKRGIDSDQDGLDNDCECALGTESGDSDTDADGLPDGFEDANQNCRLDLGETLATEADTDSDGVLDGMEVSAGLDPLNRDSDSDGIEDGVEFMTCLDPLHSDTDEDGIKDGVEDANGDGEIGICPDRMYAASCAQGEYDPCKADTDGDGEEDGEEVNFLGCRDEFLNAIIDPQLISDQPGDFQLALDQQAQPAAVTGVGSAYAFNHEQAAYAGFIAPVSVAVSDVEQMRDLVLNRVRTQYPSAQFESTGRRTQTHEGFEAMVSIKIDLASSGQANTGRDFALTGLLQQGSVSHGLGGSFATSAGNLALIVGIVQKANNTFLVTGAVAANDVYEDTSQRTGYLVDDVTSAKSVASFDEALESACVAYRVDDRPKADFLWIIDGSGSMGEENASVKDNADEFGRILNASNLDWRLGAVSSTCIDIANDPLVPPDVKALFGGSGLTADCPGVPGGFGLSPYVYNNGALCGNSFFSPRDPNNPSSPDGVAQFKSCIDELANPSGGSVFSPPYISEHTGTMSAAAIGRALPRMENNPSKLRPNAATIVISVTDEFDDMFEDKMNWEDAGSTQGAQTDPSGSFTEAELDAVVGPFVDYLRRPESAATAFGIYWVPGQSCATASEAAAGIDRIVTQTGGTAGSICAGNLRTTLAAIAQASAGLASGLRVEGVPVASTVDVRIGDVSTQLVEEPQRSRLDGWDYDAVTNAVSFYGAQPPETSDRVVITYKRWENSIIMCTNDSDCTNGFQKGQCLQGKCR